MSQPLRGNGLMFTPNKGQIIDIEGNLRPDILYHGDGGGANIFLRKTGLSYVYSNEAEIVHEIDEQVEDLIKAGTITESKEQKTKKELLKKETITLYRVDMDFINCNANTITAQTDEQEGYQNFYYPHCPNGILNVKQYNRLTYKNIYNNIDITYSGGKEKGIEYDIIVNPHADPSQIKFRWSGAENISLTSAGSLIIKTGINQFEENIPKVYQNINGRVVDIKAKYILQAEVLEHSPLTYKVSFNMGEYNKNYPLIIDPWLTYFGGNTADAAYGITTDLLGNVLFTGSSDANNFPTTVGAFQTTHTGIDGFVAKMNSSNVLQWSTFYGGNFDDVGAGIITDSGNNVIAAGYTNSTNIPVGALAGNVVQQNANAGNSDDFLIKLDPSGARIWATYYGGPDGDNEDLSFTYAFYSSLAVDASDNIYMYSLTSSDAGIATAGTFQPTPITSLFGYYQDMFLVKFASNGARSWATYIGGSDMEAGGNIVLEKSTGNIYVCGTTMSTDFPTSAGHQMAFGGGPASSTDAFLMKLNSSGNRIWATYYGGTGSDYGFGLALDASGNIIMAGEATSTNAISTAGAYQTAFGGNAMDGFLVKFNSAGTRAWGTYIGGNKNETAQSLAVDANNFIYVVGDLEDQGAGNYPISACAYQTTFGGPVNGEDQFIAKYTSAGVQKCVTYLGGTGEEDTDWSYGISIFGNNLYLCGYTKAAYPVTTGAYQTVYGGGNTDAFVDQICLNICESKVLGENFSASATSITAGSSVTYTPSVTNVCDTTGYRFQWTFTGGAPSTSTAINPSVTYAAAGAYDTKLLVTTICKKDSITKAAYMSVSVPTPIELLSFAATAEDNNVRLNWITASEINNDFFTLERSYDANNFQPFATIKGAGNSSQILKYTFLDKSPFEGINYYRLKQTDFDGKYFYSEIRSVDLPISKTGSFNMFPNPSSGTINIESSNIEKQLIQVFDVTGKLIYSQFMQNGKTTINLNLLSDGVYSVCLSSNEQKNNKRLVIVK